MAVVRYDCQYDRVVKEADSKSAGVTRTGSNPVADVFLKYFKLLHKGNAEDLAAEPL